MRQFSKYSGPILIALCAVFLIAQVLVRPAIGLANNNDFPKMAGPFGLGPEDGTWESHEQFGEFIYRFIRADRYNYAREFARTEFLSSEYFLVKLARGLQRMVYPGPRFDIRWLGTVSGIFFLLAIGLWIYALPARWRLAVGPLLILIWTDAAYVQYLNSFYMDAAAMIFFVLSVAFALHYVKNPQSKTFAALMVAAGSLFAMSKSQHALPGFLFAGLFLIFAIQSRDRITRIVLVAGAVAVVAGGWFVLGRLTWKSRADTAFNTVFMRITPSAVDRAGTLRDLGLGPEEVRLVGTYVYMSDSPMQNEAWARTFIAHCNYGTLLRFYLLHPSTTARLLYSGLSNFPEIRPWGNLALDDGFKGRAQSTHFTLWSDLRFFLLRHAPWHIVLLAALAILGSLWLWIRSPSERRFAELVVAVQLVASMEYAMAILADGLETERHLFMFHVATEATVLLVPWLLWKIWRLHGSRTAENAIPITVSPNIVPI